MAKTVSGREIDRLHAALVQVITDSEARGFDRGTVLASLLLGVTSSAYSELGLTKTCNFVAQAIKQVDEAMAQQMALAAARPMGRA